MYLKGSSVGSTGPASIPPESNKPRGAPRVERKTCHETSELDLGWAALGETFSVRSVSAPDSPDSDVSK